MRHLNTDPHFLAYVEKMGLKTRKGAEARLEPIIGMLAGNDEPLTFVIEVNGKFVPVAVLSDRTSWLIHSFIQHQVYCTSA